ncbi:MAG: OsmC family peroxiredoxin [Desulfobulbaceae bacterium]|nr:OsmC family peroxiredoxin [Desulfobulbaceae bacterium]
MQDYPHHYVVAASSRSDSNVELASPGLQVLESAAPAEFGGPGDLWSPETLLVASVTDCFILSFRAIARASKFDWTFLSCDAVGTLERVDKVPQFTEFRLKVRLEIPDDAGEAMALRLLDKAEHHCLITNSLKSTIHMQVEVHAAPAN